MNKDMIFRRPVRALIDEWAGRLDNAAYGELVRAMVYYSENETIDGFEFQTVAAVLFETVFAPALDKERHKQQRQIRYRERRKEGEGHGTPER